MSYEFKPFEELEFSDDWMFGKVMRNPEICKEILELLLDVKIQKIEYPLLQKELNPYYSSKGIRCDVYVKDSNKIFDIEIQNYKQKSFGKRMRYYQSILDCDDLIRGADYDKLKDSYILFICTTPPFEKSNLPRYTFKTFCEENKNIPLDDKSIKVVYNASAFEDEKNENIKAFLKFIHNHTVENNLTDKISNLVYKIKQNEANKTEYTTMNPRERDIFLEGEKQGEISGAEKNKIENAENFLKEGDSPEKVARCIGIPLETVLELQKSLSVNA